MANLELRSKKDYSPVTTAGIEITRDISEWYEWQIDTKYSLKKLDL